MTALKLVVDVDFLTFHYTLPEWTTRNKSKANLNAATVDRTTL